MSDDGVSGQGGVPLSIKSVSKVWQRVCRDVEAETAGKASAGRLVGRKMPSRISPDWRPVIVSSPPIGAQVSQGAPPAAVAVRDAKGDVELTPEAKAEKARALEYLDDLDRKTFGIPR
jgi:cell wall assembly regulator SMI1